MRRPRRSAWTVTVLIALAVAAWAAVTQPTLGGGGRDMDVTVDPARLRAHVEMLAKTLLPRDHGHPENLDKVAA